MKTKIAFLLGGVLGYVLGARAGRKRYEQIKSGAQKVWNSAPVQNGVGAAQGYAQDRVNQVVAAAFDAGKSYFTKDADTRAPQVSTAPKEPAQPKTEADPEPETGKSGKPAGEKPGGDS